MFAWTALLGCEDFRNMEELRSGRGHRRPSGPDMYDVVSRLAAITSQAEVRSGWGCRRLACGCTTGEGRLPEC